MSEYKAVGGRVVTPFFVVLGLIAMVGLYFLAQRFIHGLGAVTHLNNGYPWGIWVAYDIVIGTAFACGGFALALVVYVANKGVYHPLIRPAVLASLLGYSLGAASALIDMGRYWQAYNIFLPWHMNPNSVMLEVGLCVAAYTLILVIEFLPVYAEKMNKVGLKQWLNRIMFVVLAIGVLLPTMHQSSLGSMLILAGHKISPLWQTQLLPLLFLISAVTMGFAIVVFEASLSSSAFRLPGETPLLERLASLICWLLGIYLAVRLLDILIRGHFGDMFAGTLVSNMFLLEMLLFITPLVVLSSRKNRQNAGLLFVSAVSLLLAGALYRLDAYIIAFDPGPGYSYFPSFPELMVTLGIVAIEIMVFLIVVKKMPVLHASPKQTAGAQTA